MNDDNRYMLDLIDGNHARAVKWMGRIIVILALLLALMIVFYVRSDRLHKEALAQQEQRWLDYLSQYDFESVTTEYTQDGHGLNIIGDQNGVNVNGPEIPQDDANQDAEESQ